MYCCIKISICYSTTVCVLKVQNIEFQFGCTVVPKLVTLFVKYAAINYIFPNALETMRSEFKICLHHPCVEVDAQVHFVVLYCHKRFCRPAYLLLLWQIILHFKISCGEEQLIFQSNSTYNNQNSTTQQFGKQNEMFNNLYLFARRHFENCILKAYFAIWRGRQRLYTYADEDC